MELGIFSKTFARPSLEQVLDAVVEHNFRSIQFDMSCAGLPDCPDEIDAEAAWRIKQAAQSRGIQIAAVSGTFNMAHPDATHRENGVRGLGTLAAACADIGATVISLCTGTRDPENMWRRHPDNDSPSAWLDMARTVSAALELVEPHRVTLAVEPELSNVVSNAVKAEKLLREMESPYLSIVMDGANLFDPDVRKPLNDVMDDAFDRLGEHIVMAHAKDVRFDGKMTFVPAGQGMVDYGYYIMLLEKYGVPGPLLLHGLDETEVQRSVQFLKSKMQTMD